MRHISLLIAFTFVASLAHAQTVFRSVMPDGRVVYGDEPAAGAKESRTITLPPSNVLTTPKPAAPASKPAAPISKPTPESIPAPKKPAEETPDAQVANAEKELEAAQAALEAGREARQGERVGMVGGNSRLTEGYFERIKSLEAAVAAAQRKLEDAYEMRRYAR
jgi:hypothetical protein